MKLIKPTKRVGLIRVILQMESKPKADPKLHHNKTIDQQLEVREEDREQVTQANSKPQTKQHTELQHNLKVDLNMEDHKDPQVLIKPSKN